MVRQSLALLSRPRSGEWRERRESLIRLRPLKPTCVPRASEVITHICALGGARAHERLGEDPKGW
jgi:hypothetical protein